MYIYNTSAAFHSCQSAYSTLLSISSSGKLAKLLLTGKCYTPLLALVDIRRTSLNLDMCMIMKRTNRRKTTRLSRVVKTLSNLLDALSVPRETEIAGMEACARKIAQPAFQCK